MARASIFQRSVRVRKTIKEDMVELNLTMAEAQDLANILAHVGGVGPGRNRTLKILEALNSVEVFYRYGNSDLEGSVYYRG